MVSIVSMRHVFTCALCTNKLDIHVTRSGPPAPNGDHADALGWGLVHGSAWPPRDDDGAPGELWAQGWTLANGAAYCARCADYAPVVPTFNPGPGWCRIQGAQWAYGQRLMLPDGGQGVLYLERELGDTALVQLVYKLMTTTARQDGARMVATGEVGTTLYQLFARWALVSLYADAELAARALVWATRWNAPPTNLAELEAARAEVPGRVPTPLDVYARAPFGAARQGDGGQP